MKMDMTTPCDSCPFRTDVKPYLTQGRVEEITDAIVEQQHTFSCHKTNDSDDEGDAIETEDSQHCAGAMIFLEKLERPNQWMRFMERFGDYDHTKLNMDAPVFDSAEEMIEAQPR